MYCLRYAHSHHIESYLGKKQPQAKIAIAFLFGQLHFNNVTSHALFYGGHLVLRSKRCAVQNQGITLRKNRSCSDFKQLRFPPGGEGVTQQNLTRGGLRPEVQPLTLLYTIFERKGTPFVYLPLGRSLPV